jgi:cell division protein FtsW
LALLIVVLQKDLGTMIAIVAIILFTYFMSGASLKNIGIYTGTILTSVVAAVLLFPHRLERVLTFFNPTSDIEGAGYHINQALIAIGSGGLFGKGLGHSVQVFGYLPEAANDSIFAIVAEVFGFVGTIVVLILFGLLFIRMIRIMSKSDNVYMQLLVAGVIGWVLAHTVINIGAMLGLMPLTGITLPFLSLGGTSLVMIMAALGLVFNISRYTSLNAEVKEPAYARSRNRRRHSRAR